MDEETVYIGFWTNCDNDSAFGATLTLPTRIGNLLIAFLAVFVSFSGGHLWGIICFVIHQVYSTKENRDGLHFQRQVLLRSGLPNSTFLWRLIETTWSWRRSTINSIKRSMPVMVVALLHLTLVFTASIFSSRIAHVSDEVLVRSTLCGWLNSTLGSVANQLTPGKVTQDALASSDALAVAARWSYMQSLQHTRNCYQNVSKSAFAQCDKYVIPRIESHIDRAALCPFKQGVCTTPAVTLDSGLIDSHIHLGINAPATDRVQLRKITSCAPFPLEEKYGSDWSKSLYGGPDDLSHKYFYLGPMLDHNGGADGPPFTFQIVAWNVSALKGAGFYDAQFWVFSPGNLTESNFQPIEDFYRNDADINILSLMNTVAYTAEVTDPLFKAWVSEELLPGPGLYWYSNRTTSGLGCIEQYQFCGSEECTNAVGYYQVNDSIIQPLNFNKRQLATFELLLQALWASRIKYMDYLLSGDWLLAKDKLYGRISLSSPIEENHWQMEVENIHNATLALLQRRVVEHALPPPQTWPVTGVNKFIIPPATPESESLCNSQKIRSPAYQSFSVFGVASIFFGGVFLIGFKYALPTVLDHTPLRSGQNSYRREQWTQDWMLQLYRLAAEGQGITPWRGQQSNAPVTVEFAKEFHLNHEL